ncbi:MAG: hypothetical protein AB7H96_17020 [Vicinamibacterales bacterium]
MPGDRPTDALFDELRAATSAPDLFRHIYAFLAGPAHAEDVRKIFMAPPGALGYDVRDAIAPLEERLTQLFREHSTVDWDFDFAGSREALVDCLISFGVQRKGIHVLVGALVLTLRHLDSPVGGILMRESPPQYPPQPDREGFTVVYRGRHVFAELRNAFDNERDLNEGGEVHTETPPVLEHDAFPAVLELHHTYVVPPEVSSLVSGWTAAWLPKVVDDQLPGNRPLRIALVSCPHSRQGLSVDIDSTTHPTAWVYRVTCTPDEPLVTDLAQALEEETARRTGVIALPELMGSARGDQLFTSHLAEHRYRVGFVLPGSRHILHDDPPGQTEWRNQVDALDSTGRHLPGVRHWKVSRFPLPEKTVEQLRPDLLSAVRAGREVLEGIDTAPRELRLYCSHGWGRFTIGICRDLLEPAFQHFCLTHRPDHIIVLAMTQQTDEFVHQARTLGRQADAGIYIVNAGFSHAVAPGIVYVPFRSLAKRPVPACSAGHRVCVTTVELDEGARPGIETRHIERTSRTR